MPLLTAFHTPARVEDLDAAGRQSWSETLGGHFKQFALNFEQFYDPSQTETPTSIRPTTVVWSAFPATLAAQGLPDRTRWALADGSRDLHDEYCEWVVSRDRDGTLTSVTFSTEVPDYWQHVAETDREALLGLYHRLVSADVQVADLFDGDTYLRTNKWNNADSVGISHLQQGSNTLLAAIKLVADATVLRARNDGTPITDRQELVRCSAMGEPLRNSDPQIAEVINDAAALGALVTLSDPVGLYLDGIQTGGLTTPDNEDAQEFWTVDRGTASHAVRATFAVPPDRGYQLGDCSIGGRPITFGAQIADKVRVRIEALALPRSTPSARQPCVGSN
jgi:hypothetical protein